ncbi:DNA glycosylase AlkZ-like family protein [Anaerocolumna xylanovorans]|uniref:Winged helix DNA-binding domain-containing protein n=1 Tax=Anaerocolumna xylanovorans DSM 12503 TaxID=1121345 RepID=A0A1M7YLL8_9FIRM|nr:winged helix DNA-binding domain-containing protein [Anaerocolumna xylanovorans]SHO53533.1 hypothetical protein SAMN02745217_04150 [Anaerocolumna xylanovorans DSM 12503]
MKEYHITRKQARRLLLKKQGLLGEYRFFGEEGVVSYIKQAGCIQFDPVDVCGKNPELVLQSRIKGFRKEMLYKLLYEDRVLIDYFDKNLSIFLMEDFRYFERTRKHMKEAVWFQKEVEELIPVIHKKMKETGPICSKDLKTGNSVDWYWGMNTSLTRVALENLYFTGDLIIHHKKGSIKYYAPAKEYLGKEYRRKDPLKEDYEHLKWRVLRRISGVGLLWNKPSDAWLGVRDLKARDREKIFGELLEKGKIAKLIVEDFAEPLYCLKEDVKYITEKEEGNCERTELLAPLDNMLWDRKLISQLFGFDYKWEIYTPEDKRKYGYYVLPILSGDEIIGRGEFVSNRKDKVLEVRRLWLEKGKDWEDFCEPLNETILKFADFNGAKEVCYYKDFVQI